MGFDYYIIDYLGVFIYYSLILLIEYYRYYWDFNMWLIMILSLYSILEYVVDQIIWLLFVGSVYIMGLFISLLYVGIVCSRMG